MKLSQIAAIFEAAGCYPIAVVCDGAGYTARFQPGRTNAAVKVVEDTPGLGFERVILGPGYCGVKFAVRIDDPPVEPEPLDAADRVQAALEAAKAAKSAGAKYDGDPLDVNDPEVRAGLKELDRQIRRAARKLWAGHPNNPSKLPEPPAGVVAHWGDMDERGARTYSLKLTIPGKVYCIVMIARRHDGAYTFSGHRGKDNGQRGAMGPRQLEQCERLISLGWDMLTAALEARGWTHELPPAPGRHPLPPIHRQRWHPPAQD